MAKVPSALASSELALSPRVFLLGCLFYALGALGGLIADGFPEWSFPVLLDFYTLALLVLAVAGVTIIGWSYVQGAAVLLYGGASTFLVTWIYQQVSGSVESGLSAYNNLFVISLFLGPSVFLAGQWGAALLGIFLSFVLVATALFAAPEYLVRHLWFEIPAVVGVSIILYRYRRALDRTVENLRKKARENQILRDRERLASLGELAAGISHELKNPLNLVVGFAESSRQLLSELEQSPPEDQAYWIGELRKNMEEIERQGQRGVRVVRSLLGKVRASTEYGEFELSELAAECLQLAALLRPFAESGFRVEHEFQPAHEPLFVRGSREDVARAILNLCTNAFWAAADGARKKPGDLSPMVSVSVERWGSQGLVVVRDNGPGFDDSVRDKLFTPFFTTKPAGEGTGLGLALCREVVQDQHGGRIDARGDLNPGAEFRVYLPLSGSSS